MRDQIQVSNSELVPFKLGKWLVEPDHCRLSADSTQLQIEPKTMEVLVYLARKSGRVIDSEQIIEHVWQGRPMSDNPVYKCIAKLRKALNDDPDNPTFIQTIPKRGYKLIHPVEWHYANAAASPITVKRPIRLLWLGFGLICILLFAFYWQPTQFRSNTSLQLVSHFPGSHSQADFSPDGQQIVFVIHEGIYSRLYISTLGEDHLKQLTTGKITDSFPRWAPSGESILFNRDKGVWLFNLQDSHSTLWIANAKNARWSPDGKKIVFERRHEIWLADESGGNQHAIEGLKKADNLLADRFPAFSPNGNFIAYFQSEDTPFGDLWIIPTSGGLPKQVTESPALGGGPVWTPDQKYLIYSSSRGGSRTLWKVAVDGSEASPLLTSSGDDIQPSVAADGQKILYANSRGRFILTSTHLDSHSSRNVFESRSPILAPELSPDHNMIAFFGQASIGGMQIFTLPTSGGRPTMITHEKKAINAIPQWSASGQHLYYYQTAEQNSFRKIRIGDNVSEKIADDWQWNMQNATRVHPDEKRMIYSGMDKGAPVATLIKNISNGQESIFPRTLEWPRWSKDGTQVVTGIFDEQRTFGDIAICTIHTAECKILAYKAHIPTWSYDEKRIYYVREDGDYQDLWSIDVHGKEKERHHLRMGPLYHPGPFYRVSKDNEVYWIKYEKPRNELWFFNLKASQ